MSKNSIITGAISLGLVGLMTAGAFAETSGGTPTSASTTSTAAAKIACVGAAVNTREAALDTAIATHGQTVDAAYKARATALQQAYTGTTNTQVKAAVKAAWAAFRTSMKEATKTWHSAQKAAWSAFRTAAKACKAPGSISDNGNADSEAMGQ